MSRSYTEEEIKKTERITVRNQRTETIQTIVFPHHVKIGLDDKRYQSSLSIAGALQLGEISNSPTKPPDSTGGVFYVKSDGKPYFCSYRQAEVDLLSGSLAAEDITGRTLITDVDSSNDYVLIWDATDSSLKKVAPTNLVDNAGGAISAVANGVDNRIATFSSADALNGEANLTFNGSELLVAGSIKATSWLWSQKTNAADTGGLYLDNLSTHANAAITSHFRLDNSSGTQRYAAKITVGKVQDWDSAANTDAYMSFFTIKDDAASEVMRLQNNKVGIGTTSPGYMLDIYPASGNSHARVRSADGSAYMLIDASANNDPTLYFREGGSNKWIIGNDADTDAFMISTNSNLSSAALTVATDGAVTTSGQVTAVGGVLATNNITTTHDINVAGDIVHYADTDTKIAFTVDNIDIYAGGVQMISMIEDGSQDKVIINEGEVDVDFEVRYDSGTGLKVEATTGTTTVNQLTALAGISATNDIQGGNLYSVNDVFVSANLVHWFDTDTKIAFDTDQIDFYAGNVKMITLDETTQNTVVINEDSADVDFRVESDVSTHALFVRGSDSRVGLGTSAPSEMLHIKSASRAAIFIEADTDNTPETDTAFIKMSQDGGAVQAYLGFSPAAGKDPANVNYTGALSNALLLGSTSNYPLQIGTNDNVRMTFEAGGNVGIGTTDPQVRLHIKQSTDGSNNDPGNALRLEDADGVAFWNIGLDNDSEAGKPELAFRFGDTGGEESGGGYMHGSFDEVAFQFTGQHMSTPASGSVDDFSESVGMIVVSSGEYSNISTSSIKPSINESLPSVALSLERNQKSVFGVISSVEDVNEEFRRYKVGAFGTKVKKNDNRLVINSLGEGAIWVSNVNGNLENGDYITSCEIPGLGMKQDDDLFHSYTVAKTTQSCNFDLESVIYTCEEFEHDGKTHRRAFVGCTYHCG